MSRAIPYCSYHPLDGDSLCGTSLVVREGFLPTSEHPIQIENERVELTIGGSCLKQDSPSGIILPENLVRVEYLMRNPTKQELDIEFAFPVMHNFYGFNMLDIVVDGNEIPYLLLDHENLSKLIFEKAEEEINRNINSNIELSNVVNDLIIAQDQQKRYEFKMRLSNWAEKKLNFNNITAVVLSEYYYLKSLYQASVNKKSFYEYLRAGMDIYKCAHLYQKILEGFDRETYFDYSKIAGLWSGTGKIIPVKPVSIDMDLGQLRERENGYLPPYVYYRRNYYTRNIDDKILESSFKLITKALLISAGYPMGLVKYRVNFNPLEVHRIEIGYKQIMAIDIKGGKATGQFQYILTSVHGKRSDKKVTIMIKAPKKNTVAILPKLEVGMEDRDTHRIYNAVFDNFESNLFIAVGES